MFVFGFSATKLHFPYAKSVQNRRLFLADAAEKNLIIADFRVIFGQIFYSYFEIHAFS